jgi:ATP synthase protein I
MDNSQLKSSRGSDGLPVSRIVWFQLIGTLVAALAALLLDVVSAYSVFLGGMVCVIPNAILAKSFASALNLERIKVFRRLMTGEIVKLLLTAGMFVMVFTMVKPLNTMLFFVALVAIQLVHWITPVLLPINRVE